MKISLFILIVIISISCTKEIEIEIPDKQISLVVFSAIFPFDEEHDMSYLTVDVSSTKNIYDSSNTTISDALILYYKNNLLVDTLEYLDSIKSYIISTNLNSIDVENNYSVKVIKKGFETARGTT